MHQIYRIIEKYKYHPTVTGIKEGFPYLFFSFTSVVREYILEQIKYLNLVKATEEHDIPTKT